MTILGIEQIIYGVTDLATCRRFFADWGLKEVAHDETQARFETLNGCTILAVDATVDRPFGEHGRARFEIARLPFGRELVFIGVVLDQAAGRILERSEEHTSELQSRP